ncbi:MAG: DUF4185 domain-containing protein [Clostridiales bacterium]|nr:DUF4185 domain-containing protein [Clostridiales bacterium]
MKIRLTRFLLMLLTLCLLMPLAALGEDEEIHLTATPAKEWTELFHRLNQKEYTWLSADGIFSVALDGNDSFASADSSTTTAFIFSDSLMGTSDEKGAYTSRFSMVNHSAAILKGYSADGDNLRFVWGHGGNLQPNQNIFGERRWMQDMVVVGDKLYVTGTPEVGWKAQHVDLYTIPIKGGEPQYDEFVKTPEIPELYLHTPDDKYYYVFGGCFMCNTEQAGAPDPDGYIYVYGTRDAVHEWSRKDLLVARIHEDDFPDFSKLTYWEGDKWGTDIEKSLPLLRWVSCEMSVTPITVGPYAGKYMAVYTRFVEGNEIAYSLSDTPWGPFTTGVTCYVCPEHGQPTLDGVGHIYCYNAKAHPHLSKGSQMLISYNTNARDNQTIWATDGYPHFIWLELDPDPNATPTDIWATPTNLATGTDVSTATDMATGTDIATGTDAK